MTTTLRCHDESCAYLGMELDPNCPEEPRCCACLVHEGWWTETNPNGSVRRVGNDNSLIVPDGCCLLPEPRSPERVR